MILRRLASTVAARTKAAPKPVRQTKKQKKALEHSRILAERIASGAFGETLEQPDHTAPTSPLPEDNASSTDHAITLQTLATYRPTRAPPITGPIERYRREYQRAFARLDKAFVKSQLVELWEASVKEHASSLSSSGEPAASGVNAAVMKKFGSRDGKRLIVAALLESWGWPRIEVVERERQVSAWGNTVVEKDIPMTHAEAYLLLRRDPEFTRVLVSEHRVSLTMVTRPSLYFRIKGKNKILQEVETALEARRKKIKVERINKGSAPGITLTELYQPISDMSGAFLETDTRNNEYATISYLDRSSRDRALHLLSLAQIQLELEPTAARVLALVGREAPSAFDEPLSPDASASSAVPETYALYPFISPHTAVPTSTISRADITGPSPHRDWTLTGKSLFRVRRLGGWFGSVGEDEGGRLDLSKMLARDAKSREHRKYALLRDWLKESGSSLDSEHWNTHQYERHVGVQPGHLLHRTETAQPSTLLAPPAALQGDHSLGSICRRLLDTHMRPVFLPMPSVPFDANVTEIASSTRLRRLRYRSTSSEEVGGWISTIDIEIDLDAAGVEKDQVSAMNEIEVTGATPPEANSTLRQSHRRSWYVMCPDSDRDLEIQEQMSRKLDLSSEMLELRAVIDTLQGNNESGIIPLQLELAGLGSYTLVADDTVATCSVVSKDAVSSTIDTIEASRTFSSAGTTLGTKAAFENINAALRANATTLG